MTAEDLVGAGGDLLEVALEALRPPPKMTISQWAEKKRILSDDEAEPGPWRNTRTPYLVEIMNRLSPHDPCEEVIFMKGTQIGGTEIGLNALGYWIEHAPGRILAVYPGEDEAGDFSTQRFKPMCDATPALRNKLEDEKKGTRKVFLKTFAGGSIKFAGANAPAGLRSKPIRYLFGDEIDGWTLDSGGEGDPMALAEKRQGTYSNRKRFYVSTPTLKQTSRIEPRFEAGDQRYYFVPCPHCDHFQVLKWANFVIPKSKKTGELEPRRAHMKCVECDGRIENYDKETMLARGQWRATAPYNGFRRSYHLSSLYSPVGWLSWAHIAEEWKRAHRDPVKLKTFVNTVLGETWDLDDGETVDEDELFSRLREPFAYKIPDAIGIITAGVDVQGDRIEVEIVGWGESFESWSLDYVIIPGDPTGREIWDDLDQVLKRRFELEGGGKIGIDAVGVDSGYEAHRVYTFTKKRRRRRIWAVKGKANDTSGAEREIWPLAWNKNAAKDASFKVVGVDTCKAHIYARLAKCTEPGPGYSHVPDDRPKFWFEQLTSEKRQAKFRNGRRYWVWTKPDHVRNEALDCRVYAYAVLHGLEGLNRKVSDVLAERARKRELDAERPRRDDRRRRRRRAEDDFIPQRDW